MLLVVKWLARKVEDGIFVYRGAEIGSCLFVDIVTQVDAGYPCTKIRM